MPDDDELPERALVAALPLASVDDADHVDALLDVVPAALARERPLEREAHAPLRAHSFAALLRRRVVVVANGFTYRGRLQGADEDDLYLRGELRWFVLPLSSVRSLARDPEGGDDGEEEDGEEDEELSSGGRAMGRSGTPGRKDTEL
jgi:hypothetical protein